ncbi:MAG: hypothetical protein ACI4GC_04455 [Acutalibacteraceae bacterium]
MGEAARVYDEVYDYHFSQAAPELPNSPRRSPASQNEPKANLRKVTPTYNNVALNKKRTVKAVIITAYVCVIAALLIMTANSFVKKNNAMEDYAIAKSSCERCQEESNRLKEELDAFMSKVDIDKFATERLGLQKVSPDNEVYMNVQ